MNKPFLFTICGLLLLTTSAYTQTISSQQQDRSRFEQELNDRDFEAIRNFLRSKRALDLQEKAKNITLSGDIRTEWRHLSETLRGETQRGGDALIDCIPVSRNDFDIEFNLRLDYDGGKTWGSAKLSFDNSAGVDDGDVDCIFDPRGFHGSGTCDGLCLRKAFFGYQIYEDDCVDFFIEVGRRNIYDIFNSLIQFDSRFDGIFLHYEKKMPRGGHWYWSLGGFVVDERVNHFAWVTEFGLINIADSGFDVTYSFIDWRKNGINRCLERNPRGFNFLNSQISLEYNWKSCRFFYEKPVSLYGAFLINHAGHRVKFFRSDGSSFSRSSFPDFSFSSSSSSCRRRISDKGVPHIAKNQNKGWYVGVMVGEVEKEGDWSFEIRYEYVEAFAIPDNDCAGICNGNVRRTSITELDQAGGNTNYQGWIFETFFAITDELTINTVLEWSHAIDTKITGSHNYSKFEVEAIYAF